MFESLINSYYFWAGAAGWCAAQFIKLLINLIKTRKVDISYFVSTGGMPSAHSALVSSLATAVGIKEGFGTPVFAIAFFFAAITMFDAAGVRYAASQQAKLLNLITEELFTKHTFNMPRLKELLGHTRLEVFAGLILGIIVGVALFQLWR